MKPKDAAAHLRAMEKAARLASRVLMASYGRLKQAEIRSKSLNDFVTVVDKKSQETIVKALRRAFPGYGFKAEEEGLLDLKELMWVIDPLDGTANYIHQFPLFCVSIGLTRNGVPLAGLVLDPVHDECFTAVRGAGAFLNGRRTRVSRVRGSI